MSTVTKEQHWTRKHS